MQQFVKTRIQQHVQDTENLFIKGDRSDSFASHFSKLVPVGTVKAQVKEFVRVQVEILWKGNALSCVKTFGTRSCKLCSKERLVILALSRNTPSKSIYKNNEVYGACRRIPRFHRFANSVQVDAVSASADESVKDKRNIERPNSTRSVASAASIPPQSSRHPRLPDCLQKNSSVPPHRPNRLRSQTTREKPIFSLSTIPIDTVGPYGARANTQQGGLQAKLNMTNLHLELAGLVPPFENEETVNDELAQVAEAPEEDCDSAGFDWSWHTEEYQWEAYCSMEEHMKDSLRKNKSNKKHSKRKK